MLDSALETDDNGIDCIDDIAITHVVVVKKELQQQEDEEASTVTTEMSATTGTTTREEEEDEHQAGQHQRHVIPSVICWSVTSSRSNSKRSFFGDYWGNHQRPKQLNPMAPSHTEAVVVIKNNSTTTQVAVAVAAPVSSTATTATPTRRSIFSLSPSPMETLAELAAKYQPDPLNRKTKSDSMLERRPTQSLLKKSPRYSGSLYSSSVSSCTASCARPQEQSRQRSVCFHDQVKVVEYQKPMERYAAQGWENQFS
eukprot:CAMPEP_0198154566 /NCGR_PEP_ID=MMETSP1443-20131203/68666_1 /TAXON_ID=186043 /ORGANISM="Entomoneis sp., Strain CCMP2396" /LENGTH=254 /DNA_ID=CAMNT_0043821245 /DNA_START=820 /DNA_END=1587 /DNA_ORIENTATION=-